MTICVLHWVQNDMMIKISDLNVNEGIYHKKKLFEFVSRPFLFMYNKTCSNEKKVESL